MKYVTDGMTDNEIMEVARSTAQWGKLIIDIRIQELSTDKTNGWETVVEHRGTNYTNAAKLLKDCMEKYIDQPNVKAMQYTLTITKEN